MSDLVSFLLPSSGISQEVLEADLKYYLGTRAHLVQVVRKEEGTHFLIKAQRQPYKEMIEKLYSDTAQWQKSEDRRQRRPYLQSDIHQARIRSLTSRMESVSAPAKGRGSNAAFESRPVSITDRHGKAISGRSIPQYGSQGGRGQTDDDVAHSYDMDSGYGSSLPSSMFGSPPIASYMSRAPQPVPVRGETRPLMANDADEDDDDLAGMYGWKYNNQDPRTKYEQNRSDASVVSASYGSSPSISRHRRDSYSASVNAYRQPSSITVASKSGSYIVHGQSTDSSRSEDRHQQSHQGSRRK